MILLKNRYMINIYKNDDLIKNFCAYQTTDNIIKASRYILNDYKRIDFILKLYKKTNGFDYKLKYIKEMNIENRNFFLKDLLLNYYEFEWGPLSLKEFYLVYLDAVSLFKFNTSEEINARYVNIPNIILNEFSWKKEITWESVFWKHFYIPYNLYKERITNWYSDGFFDLFISWFWKLYFSLNYLNDKDYFIFRYLKSDFNFTLFDKISFLLENWEIIDFQIIENPYKRSKDLYEFKTLITKNELNLLKTFKISKYQIYFKSSDSNVFWIIGDELIDFKIQFIRFVEEYTSLVEKEISNYKPLIEKDNAKLEKINWWQCHVYLMYDTINFYHKIWISNNPWYRERTLQSEKPSIEMIANKQFPSRELALAFEQALHRTYQTKRIRWEWFNLDDNDIFDLVTVLK